MGFKQDLPCPQNPRFLTSLFSFLKPHSALKRTASESERERAKEDEIETNTLHTLWGLFWGVTSPCRLISFAHVFLLCCLCCLFLVLLLIVFIVLSDFFFALFASSRVFLYLFPPSGLQPRTYSFLSVSLSLSRSPSTARTQINSHSQVNGHTHFDFYTPTHTHTRTVCRTYLQ